ncbi:MAG: type II toxin-antitoxin system PemK/MazF family toxin [Syntrophobacteraceae bacterium]
MSVLQVKRGEVYYANLEAVLGSETGKTRPVVIIQNDIGNAYSPTTIVAIITDYSGKKASYPICVAPGIDEGLKKAAIVNLAQVRTIDKRKLIMPRVASLPDAAMAEVDRALKYSLALSC